MYCEYWNLHKAPFDNVPDPSMYAECHVTMENVISETIFAIKEGNECFAVIIGDVGMGKTLSLRIIMDALEPYKYKVVLITNPGISFSQLLREIISQVTGKQCDLKNKYTLLEIFNRLLFETVDAGFKIVIFIDEANAISPANLEHLRLLTNMQDDQHNMFTLVLAGQTELAQRLEHPKRTNLFQRIGTYGRIDKLPTEFALKTYIETRLRLAGGRRKIFTDDCIPVMWNYSENGIPRLINKICKLCLKAGETNEFRTITPDIVVQVAERFQKLSQTAYQKRKPRGRLDLEFSDDEISALIDADQLKDLPVLAASLSDHAENSLLPSDVAINTHGNIMDASSLIVEDAIIKVNFPVKKPSTKNIIEVRINDDNDEIMIGNHVIRMDIPKAILKQVSSFNRESANKSAGFWAAKIIKNNPDLTKSPNVDPVYLWNEIKDNILRKITV